MINAADWSSVLSDDIDKAAEQCILEHHARMYSCRMVHEK